MFGCPGTVTGLVLKLVRCFLAALSIAFLFNYTNYTQFCSTTLSLLYMITKWQMGWSFGLTLLDIYALVTKKDLRLTRFFLVIVVGEWMTWFITLAATNGAGSNIVFNAHDVAVGPCHATSGFCGWITVSILCALISSVFTALSAFVAFWALASRRI